MMGERITVLVITALIFLTTSAAPAPTSLRGISPQDESYYKKEPIWCKDGSKSFSSDRVNDDFCDCADGTDEPGTSACPNGNFYCKNKGHTPIFIFSSRVNDGICDCCDGSDEYDGRAKCSNTCSQAGKALKEKLEKKIATFRGGLEVRKQNVELAKVTIAKEKVELGKLKQEEKTLKDVVNKLKAKKEAIDKAQMERQKEEKARKEAEEERAKKTAEQEERAKEHPEKDEHSEGYTTEREEKPESAKDEQDLDEEKVGESDKDITSLLEEKSEGLSKEELGRLVASRWTGENPNIEEEGAETVEEEDHDAGEGGSHEEDLDNEHEEVEEDEDNEEDDSNGGGLENEAMEEAEVAEAAGSTGDVASSEGPWWVKLKDKVKGMFSQPQIGKSEADRVRKEYRESNTKLRDIQSKISDLEKKMEQDFGKDGEFFSLYGQCFELREKKYTYKVCPYRNSVQVEGHSTTTLGNWDGFKDDYKSMHFVRGDRCWNGPDRSLKVKLRCGSKEELRDVDEPSRCEYVAELSTPAVCLEEKLMILERRLQDHEGGFLHDEL